MTKLYLIRHAEAEGNLYRIAQGQSNSLLTERGWQQVACLARRFADIQVDAVYASDLYRTCATASAIYQPKGLPLHRRQDLREIHVGAWEQKPWGEIQRTDQEQVKYFMQRIDLWHTPGSESPEAVRDRMLRAIREIAAENEGKTAAIVSHGCALQILLGTIQGVAIADLAETPQGGNTAVSLLEAEGEDLRIVFRDDNSHLTDPRYMGADGKLKIQRNGPVPGLYFEALRLPEQAVFLNQCAAETQRKADPSLPTLVGYLKKEPVGLIQLDPKRDDQYGWITLYWMEEFYRRQGFGVQLLGQAVVFYRPLGRKALRLSLRADETEAHQFFSSYGFHRAGGTGEEAIWEKNIEFQTEYLEK